MRRRRPSGINPTGLTAPQLALLGRVRRDGVVTVRGADLRVAKTLETRGHLTIEARDASDNLVAAYTTPGWRWTVRAGGQA